jgi:hypothetical protein
MSRSKTHIFCLGQSFRNVAVFKVFLCLVVWWFTRSIDRSIYRSVSQSDLFVESQVRSFARGCQHQFLPGFFPYSWADGLIFLRMYIGISSQHSPTRSFATVTERTRRNFCVTFSFPNLIISTLEGGQFTFQPFYSQQKQVMLPINLLKTEKQVTVLLCFAVPRFLKERALFESLHASSNVLVTAAWRRFLWGIRGMMLTGGNRSFQTETDSQWHVVHHRDGTLFLPARGRQLAAW